MTSSETPVTAKTTTETRAAMPATKHQLSTRAAIGLSLVLTLAIGATTAGWIWISTNGVRLQSEEAGRQAAVTAATSFARLAEPSAANVTRTLDVVLDDHLQAQAAATALLIEAAEGAGHDTEYIEDALRQIAWRSPILRIDVTGDEGQQYSTEQEPLQTDELEPSFRPLAEPEAGAGTTAAMAGRQTETGVTKSAAAALGHRAGAVRIEQEIDSRTAGTTYGGSGDQAARDLADEQTAGIAQLTTHAIELGEDAGWGRQWIEERLAQITDSTAVVQITANGATGQTVYEANDGTSAARQTTSTVQSEPEDRKWQGARGLEGHYDADHRWHARAIASRGNNRLSVTVQVRTQAGEGSLLESSWQAEANRLARVAGITGVWVAEINDNEVRLAAAGPTRSDSQSGRQNAWRRWNARGQTLAQQVAAANTPISEANISLIARSSGRVLSAAPAASNDTDTAIAVIIETRADTTVNRMRAEATGGIAASVMLIFWLMMMTTWEARRWITRPIEAIANAAHCLHHGERPATELTADLQNRGDEIGVLARSFGDMTEEVLARHEELTKLVEARTENLLEVNDKLRDAHDRMEREIDLARTVQRSLVPEGTRTAGRLTLCSKMTPANELGGDFINIEEQDGDELLVAVCDVSGKGVGAALFMAVAQSAVREAAASRGEIAEIAQETNRRLCEGNTLGMFVTGLLMKINTNTGWTEIVSAGHEAAIRIKNGEEIAKLNAVKALPFGLEADEQYVKRVYELEPGETIVGYTDGITDACNDTEEAFGEQRLQDVIEHERSKSAEEVLHGVWSAIQSFSEGTPSTDDKTCMVIRYV